MKNTDKEWIELVESKHYKLIIDNSESTDDFIKLIKPINPNMLVIDYLNTSEGYIKSIKKTIKGIKIISFEDLGRGSLYTDLTINELYPSVIQSSHILSGPNYCFFRDEFVKNSSKQDSNKKYDILISFGGTDPNNLTLRTLKVINQIKNKILKVRVILGIGAQRLTRKLKEISMNSNHEITFNNPKEGKIAEEFSKSLIGITGGGRTVYEFHVCKLNTIVLCQNSRELTHLYASDMYGIQNLGLHSEISDIEIKKSINSLIAETTMPLKSMIFPKVSNQNVINNIKKILK